MDMQQLKKWLDDHAYEYVTKSPHLVFVQSRSLGKLKPFANDAANASLIINTNHKIMYPRDIETQIVQQVSPVLINADIHQQKQLQTLLLLSGYKMRTNLNSA